MSEPFFLVGCVRSGTTLLRNLLKAHPNLACPDETHFFRWPHPFSSGNFTRIVRNNAVLKKHRRNDCVDEQDYLSILKSAETRRDLQNQYIELFLRENNKQDNRWFEKTPQNVYGLLLLSAMYPESKFVSIHRHPLNVVASLKAGKVMAKHSLVAAINAWLEATLIIREYKSAWPDRIHELAYEDLTNTPEITLNTALEFLDEPTGLIPHKKMGIHREKNKYKKILSAREIDKVRNLLGKLPEEYNYK